MDESVRRGKRMNSPFTDEQETWIVLEFGAVRNCLAVRRRFRTKFHVAPRKIPSVVAFQRIIGRFHSTLGHVRPAVPKGRPPISEETVDAVRQYLAPFVERKEAVSLRLIAESLHISISTVWRVLRKRLHWYPYKPHAVVPLGFKHRSERREFSEWLLGKDERFPDRVIWTDEKWFTLSQAPNRQNERYWAPCNPNVDVECKVQGERKVMCWAAIVGGQVMIHWFDQGASVNGSTYMDVLENVLWPKVRAVAEERGLWFQQDGATVHTTRQARAWLNEAFRGRVISRLTDHPWPARSPDLSPLDFWFWSVALTELRRRPPHDLEELKQTVEAFADSLDEDEVLRAVRNVRTRARACMRNRGGGFECTL